MHDKRERFKLRTLSESTNWLVHTTLFSVACRFSPQMYEVNEEACSLPGKQVPNWVERAALNRVRRQRACVCWTCVCAAQQMRFKQVAVQVILKNVLISWALASRGMKLDFVSFCSVVAALFFSHLEFAQRVACDCM